MSKMLLTFELDNTGLLEVHGNREGLLNLAKILTQLADEKSPDHAHLMTEEWGGGGLTSEVQCLENTLLNQVKIFVWPSSGC